MVMYRTRYADTKDVDPYPTFHFDANPDLDPDPTPSFTKLENFNSLN
jgi:hypothetical protein